jgi:hypothetical protein
MGAAFDGAEVLVVEGCVLAGCSGGDCVGVRFIEEPRASQKRACMGHPAGSTVRKGFDGGVGLRVGGILPVGQDDRVFL